MSSDTYRIGDDRITRAAAPDYARRLAEFIAADIAAGKWRSADVGATELSGLARWMAGPTEDLGD